MKKNFKRTLAKVMAVALTVSMVGIGTTDADAAKKIKLSSKSISVAKGATKKVTIKNVKAKKVKKLTVKSANKKIATVKKAGKTAIKVTGKKAGKSTKVTVKVKVGKKTTKLTLKVKVTKAKNPVVPTPEASASATPAASASATPATSANPDTSAKPDTSANPDTSAKPDTSANPDTSAKPDTSANPDTSATPDTSANPDTSAKPDTSANPDTSAKPDTSANPDTSAKPDTSANPDTSAAPTEAPVQLETLSIENVQLGGTDASKITKFSVENGVVDMILNSNAQYGNVFSYFDVELPEGATVRDIKKITYDIEGVTGDLANKWNAVIVGSPNADDATAFPIDGHIEFKWDGEGYFDNVLELYRSVTYGASFNGGKVSEVAEFDDDNYSDIDDLEITGNTIRMSIFANLEGKPTEYKISNIKVYTTKGVVAKEGFDKPGDTIDASLTAEIEGSISGKTSVAVGETISVEAAITNPVLVGEATNVVWTSSNKNIATVTQDATDITKAVVTGVESGTVEVSADISTSKGKTKTLKATISVTKDAVKIEEVALTCNYPIIEVKADNQYSNVGAVSFSDLAGCPKDLNLSNYSSIEVTLKFYDSDGKILTTDFKGSSTQGWVGKFCLTDDVSSVWGDGIKKESFDSVVNTTGEMVLTFDSADIDGFSNAKGFNSQLSSTDLAIQKVVIDSVVFKP